VTVVGVLYAGDSELVRKVIKGRCTQLSGLPRNPQLLEKYDGTLQSRGLSSHTHQEHQRVYGKIINMFIYHLLWSSKK
jgi:hypothetical protein